MFVPILKVLVALAVVVIILVCVYFLAIYASRDGCLTPKPNQKKKGDRHENLA